MRARSAKAEILAAIRTNLSASADFETPHSDDHSGLRRKVPDQSDHSNVPAGRSALDVFCENLISVGGRFTIVNDLPGVEASVRSILSELVAKRIAVSDSHLVRHVASSVAGANVLESPTTTELFHCDVGITEAQWGIAETGTLVLESNAEASRLTSLVPDAHICILRAARIRLSMGEILGILEGQLSPVVTFITGPSRTSDIELTLAIGVHGPRELDVIVLDD